MNIENVEAFLKLLDGARDFPETLLIEIGFYPDTDEAEA